MKKIDTVKDAYTNLLMAIPGVQGVGTGSLKSKPTLKVYVSEGFDIKLLPSKIEGFVVEMEISGTFEFLPVEKTFPENLIGLSKVEAQQKVKLLPMLFRIRREDKQHFIGTCDFRTDRVNVEIDVGKISSADIG